jgi:putative glutathione S-transferase
MTKKTETSACGWAPEEKETSACGWAPEEKETSACGMAPRARAKGHSHVPEAHGTADWSGGNRVGDYHDSERAVPRDTWFNTPFAGGREVIGQTYPIDSGDSREGQKELPVEAGRYRLIWTPLCPWATRLKIVLNLLGIGEDVVSVGTADPVRTPDGWKFTLDPEEKDPVLGISALREIYEKTAPGEGWNDTVPVLVDVREGKVVNNDYHHLPNYFETVWKSFWKSGAPDLYPEKYRTQIDRLNRVLFNDVTNRVYLAGYAETQAEYEHSYVIFFKRLDALEAYLGQHRFLLGNRLTDADVRLYVTLSRLDAAYYFAFRLNRKRLRDYDNLWNYAKELYSIPAFREATDFDAIKRGYFLGYPAVNPWKIVPDGPDESVWTKPNNRAEKFGPLEVCVWR